MDCLIPSSRSQMGSSFLSSLEKYLGAQHEAVPRIKCHCSVLGVLLPLAGAGVEDRAVGAARLPCARLRGRHGKWLGTTSEISYLFACLYFYLFPPPSRSLELS